MTRSLPLFAALCLLSLAACQPRKLPCRPCPACTAPAPTPTTEEEALPPAPENRPLKAFVGGTVVHTRLASADAPRTLEDATVLVKGSRIEAVGPAAEVTVPAGAQRIDARGLYLIPGLVDGHVHFFQSGGLYTRPDGLDLRHRVPYAAEIKRIRGGIDTLFRRYLRCGVTTVVDMGGPFWNFEVREQARDGRAAPRTFVAGPLIASYQPPQLDHPDLPIVRVTNEEEALALARRQIERGTDLIKIWYVVSKKAALDAQAFFPIAKAVAELAHRHKLPVFIHATELQTAKLALRAGADVLVHSVVDAELDAEFFRLARQRQAVVIPTLWVFNSYAAVYTKQLRLMPVESLLGDPEVIATLFEMHELRDDELGERQRKLLAENKPIAPNPTVLKNLRALHREGIPVAVGTDAGNVGVLHGPAIFHDFKIMAEAGISPHQILVDATMGGARLLGRQAEIGSLEPGKLADIVLLRADPLADVQNTSEIAWVVKGGRLLDPRRLLPRTARDLAQIQLDAYNARQIEPFLAVYADDVEVYDFPNTLVFRGKEAMRQRYRAFFGKAKALHARLVGRVSHGRFVVDQEDVVTGIPGRSRLRALAIYEVSGGLIQRIWFVR